MPGWSWLVGKVGLTAARWIVWIIVVFIVWGLLLAAFRFNDWRGRSATDAQARQTTASGEAIGKAGSNAVNTATDRANDDAAIDRDVSSAQERIDNAQNPDDVHRAVRDALCMRDPSRRECATR